MSSTTKSRKSTKTEEVVPEPVAAPVVELAAVEVAAEESNETYESVMTVVREKRAAIKVLDKEVDALMKTAEKLHAREVKAGGKSKRSAPKKDRAPSGFVKPTLISKELANFLGKPVGTEWARTEVTREINAYIRTHSLQDKENGRKINPDTKLKSLLQVKKGEELTYFNLQQYMSRHFAKASAAPVAVAVA